MSSFSHSLPNLLLAERRAAFMKRFNDDFALRTVLSRVPFCCSLWTWKAINCLYVSDMIVHFYCACHTGRLEASFTTLFHECCGEL